MDNGQYINLLARIEAIKAEIEAGKLSNRIRLDQGHVEVNYTEAWFIEKSRELQSIADEPFR